VVLVVGGCSGDDDNGAAYERAVRSRITSRGSAPLSLAHRLPGARSRRLHLWTGARSLR